MARIFYLEDDPILTTIFESKLKDAYEVRVFNRYSDFVEAVQEQPPDLFVLDLMIPDINGMDVVRFLRNSLRFQFIPIIVLTSLDKDKHLQTCLETGADDFVVKPPAFKELQARIDSLIFRYADKLDYARQRKFESIKLLINGFNHEFNNHLMILQGGVEIMLNAVSDDRMSKNLSAMSRTIERAATLIRGVSDLYSGGFTVKARGYFEEFCDGFADQINSDLEFDGIELVIHLPHDQEFYINIGESNLYLVLKHLISNAEDSFFNIEDNRDRKVEVIFCREDDYLSVKVKDNGRGIAQQNLSHVFDPFYTTKGSLGGELIRNKKHGTGLGLSLAEAIIEGAGGKIILRSIEGKGTEVEVMVPLIEGEGQSAFEFEPFLRMRRPNAESFKLALTHPEDDQLSLLKRFLELQNCEVVSLDGEVEATLENERFSLLLMHHECGKDVIQKRIDIVRKKEGKYFPVILMVPEDEGEGYHDLVSSNNLKCISLPVSYRGLTDALQDIQVYVSQ